MDMKLSDIQNNIRVHTYWLGRQYVICYMHSGLKKGQYLF